MYICIYILHVIYVSDIDETKIIKILYRFQIGSPLKPYLCPNPKKKEDTTYLDGIFSYIEPPTPEQDPRFA